LRDLDCRAKRKGEHLNLGKYEIIEELGKGGFGTVYKAHDTVLNVERALKVLHPALVADETFLARFKQEAQLAASLEHPNLVPVYDFGEIKGRYFLAMKYMPAGSVKDLLEKEGKLDEKRAIEIIDQACSGMAYAHSQGIIHRDLKPGNLLLDKDGSLRVGDLGFARSLAGTNTASLTISGGMVGTPAYIAPEIWYGKPAIEATDIYSMGCILYEILTGRVLFQGESPADVMKLHVLDQPGLEGISGPLQVILRSVLAKEPADRPKSMAAFQELLAGIPVIESPLIPELPVAPPPSQPIEPQPAPAGQEKPPESTNLPPGPGVSENPVPPPVFVHPQPQNQGLPPANGIVRPAPKKKMTWVIWVVIAAVVSTVICSILYGIFSFIPALFLGSLMEGDSASIRENDGMEKIYIPAGEFTMGSSDAYSDTQPIHMVTLDAYYMDKFEVNNAQYARCVAEGACLEPASFISSTRSNYYGNSDYANYPVVNVNWYQAQAYCAWAGGSLPTEAQWEKAARGQYSYIYPWGNEFDGRRLNYCDRNCQGVQPDDRFDDGYADTSPVGHYQDGLSPYGVMDMAGNVFEWVADWYQADYYSSMMVWNNPTGPLGGTAEKVLRGGSFEFGDQLALTFVRFLYDPEKSNPSIGFRCVTAEK